MTAQERYEYWRANVKDATLAAELEQIRGNREEIENRFYKELEFGTGGLRGEIAAGSNCLNVYTIRKATAGLAEYLVKNGGKLAAISYDSRINSRLFAETAACVLAARGIRVRLVSELMPTPFLSFATRYYGADAGIMITASHNPARYNGYKAYGPDGCQITEEAAGAILKEIAGQDPFLVPQADYAEAVEKGIISEIPAEVEEKYLAAVAACGLGTAAGLSVAYTPLNGTGYRLVPEILRRSGIKAVEIVPEQSRPDGNFPTCPYPNPEKKEALQCGIRLLEASGADVLLATDPDADRLGVAVRHRGGIRLMTGNEIGALLADFLFARRKALGTLPASPVLVKTIVTSELGERVAASYGGETVNVLTGFKYIGELIGRLEADGRAGDFILGYEESYGYLAGSYVRDKDGVLAAMLVAQMAAYYLEQGKTLADRIEELYAEYGVYSHRLLNYEFAGADGAREMARRLSALRDNPPAALAGKPVAAITDYLQKQADYLPLSNVLRYALKGGGEAIVRPSGTEPQIKVYLTAVGETADNLRLLDALQAEFDAVWKEN